MPLRERYRIEREKRLRPDGNDQYVEMTGEFARYLDDPYIDGRIERGPVTDQVDVVLIGGGFGGLQTAARLREAGIDDLMLIEKGSDFGGTWYWNRYPGAPVRCGSLLLSAAARRVELRTQGEVRLRPRDPRPRPRRSGVTTACTGRRCSRRK